MNICINIYSPVLLLMLALCPHAMFGAQTLRMTIVDVDEKQKRVDYCFTREPPRFTESPGDWKYGTRRRCGCETCALVARTAPMKIGY